jgi:PAS domain S-box-containing protein
MACKTPPHPGRWTAARISGLYALMGGVWIYTSDRLIDLLTGQAHALSALQTYKGWLFVGVTAPLLYGLISAGLKPSRQAKDTVSDDAREVVGDIPPLWSGALTPLLIFLLLTAAIGAMGYVSYVHQKQILQAGKQAELTAITDTKVRQIADWMNERRGDALALSSDPFLVQAVQHCLRNDPAGAAGSADQNRLMERLKGFQAIYGYRTVALLSISGETLVCAGELPEDAHLQQQVAQVLHSDDLTVFDLHRNSPADTIEMTLMAPLKWRDTEAEKTIGVVYLRIDPQRYLFPLIQSWPLPSATAETLLVRANGTDVVYLNELRHRAGTALNLRLSLSEPHLPAAMAVRGQVGIVQGVDYRRVPVLAAIRAVSGTPWFMVAKVDIDEIYAPIREVALLVAVLAGILIATAGLGVVLWWRQQHALFTAEHYRNALERKALVRHFDYLARHANDIVLLTDEQGQIIEANDRALEAYGFSREELRQRPIQALHEPGHQARITAQLALIESSGGLIYETLHQHRDGSPFPVEVSARGMVIDNKRFFQHIIRDVSERKQLLMHTEQQTRILDAILAATPDQVWMRDRAGRYLYANAAALRAIGRQQAEQVIGKTWAELGLPATLMESLTALHARDNGFHRRRPPALRIHAQRHSRRGGRTVRGGQHRPRYHGTGARRTGFAGERIAFPHLHGPQPRHRLHQGSAGSLPLRQSGLDGAIQPTIGAFAGQDRRRIVSRGDRRGVPTKR